MKDSLFDRRSSVICVHPGSHGLVKEVPFGRGTCVGAPRDVEVVFFLAAERALVVWLVTPFAQEFPDSTYSG